MGQEIARHDKLPMTCSERKQTRILENRRVEWLCVVKLIEIFSGTVVASLHISTSLFNIWPCTLLKTEEVYLSNLNLVQIWEGKQIYLMTYVDSEKSWYRRMSQKLKIKLNKDTYILVLFKKLFFGDNFGME